MGSVCCCPCGDDFEEYLLPSNPVYRHCACLRYFFHQLFSGYSAQFQRLDGRSVPSPNQAATSFFPSGTGTPVTNNSLNDTPFSVARPSPFDADQRYSRMQRDGLISRREKSMTHLQEDTQQVRRSNSATQSLGLGKKLSGVEAEEDCKLGESETSEKELTSKVEYGLNYVLPSSEMMMSALHALMNIPLRILKSQQNVLTISTLAVFMNGWKEVKVVQFVGRRWSSVKAPNF